MRLAEYSDDEIIAELKHRGIKIEAHIEPLGKWAMGLKQIKIGEVVFELRTYKRLIWRCVICGTEGFDEQSRDDHIKAYSNSPLKAKIEERYDRT